MQQIKVYVTSKRRHAPLLLRRLSAAPGVHVVSRWMETTHREKLPVHYMPENFDDIVSSHVVLVYAELGDRLRQSIGEVYYGLAHSKPIFVVGQRVDNADGSGVPGVVYHPDYDDWSAYAPHVRRAGDLDHAIAQLRAWANGGGDRIDRLGVDVRTLSAAVHDLREKIVPSTSRGDRTSA